MFNRINENVSVTLNKFNNSNIYIVNNFYSNFEEIFSNLIHIKKINLDNDFIVEDNTIEYAYLFLSLVCKSQPIKEFQNKIYIKNTELESNFIENIDVLGIIPITSDITHFVRFENKNDSSIKCDVPLDKNCLILYDPQKFKIEKNFDSFQLFAFKTIYA